MDFRIKADSAAVDKGVALPNVTDGFAGRAPDLGANEAGQPLPHFGPRNWGVPPDRDGRGRPRLSRFHQLESALTRRQRTHNRAGMSMPSNVAECCRTDTAHTPAVTKRLPLSEELVWSTHASNVPSQTNAFSLEALWRAEAIRVGAHGDDRRAIKLSTSASAQFDTATVVGTVSDSSGGAVLRMPGH